MIGLAPKTNSAGDTSNKSSFSRKGITSCNKKWKVSEHSLYNSVSVEIVRCNYSRTVSHIY